MRYGFDSINGREVPQMVVDNDSIIQGSHTGTIHVENGTLTVKGNINGSLDVQSDSKVIIIGRQHGSVLVGNNAEVIIFGKLDGSTNVSNDGTVVIEESGKMLGSLHNNGTVIVRGGFSGAHSGNGELILEGNGYIKQPTVKNGINYYKL